MSRCLVDYDDDDDDVQPSAPSIANTKPNDTDNLTQSKAEPAASKPNPNIPTGPKKINLLNLVDTKKIIEAKDTWVPTKIDFAKKSDKASENGNTASAGSDLPPDFENPFAKKFLSALSKPRNYVHKKHPNVPDFAPDPFIRKKIKTTSGLISGTEGVDRIQEDEESHGDISMPSKVTKEGLTIKDKEIIQKFDRTDDSLNLSDANIKEVKMDELLDINWRQLQEMRNSGSISARTLRTLEPTKEMKNKNQLLAMAYEKLTNTNPQLEQKAQFKSFKRQTASKYGW
jgi:hypothetical protein